MAQPGDIAVQLEPGQTTRIKRAGEFVYLKFGEQPLELVIQGTRTRMEVGDKRRARIGERFTELEVTNAGDYPSAFVFVIGDGDYDRQIIQGEVAVRPSIRGSDGRLRSDTRRDVGLYIDIQPDRIEESAGQSVAESNIWPDNATAVAVNREWFAGGHSEAWTNPRILVVDRKSGATVFSAINGGTEGINSDEDVVGLAFDDRRRLMYAITDNSSTDRGIYVWSTVTWQPISKFNYSQRPYGMAVMPDRGGEVVVRHDPLNSDGRLAVWRYYGFSWQQVRTSPESPTLRGGLAYFGGLLWTLQHGGTQYETYDPDTLEKVGEGSFGSGYGFYGADGDDDLGRIWGVTADKHLRYQVPEDIVRAGQVGATLDGCAIPGLLTPDLRYTTANVTLERTPDGGVFASGEVVKAVVEAYLGYGVRVPDDYLDHVFGITFPDGRRIESGYESFAAAGVEDDFYVEFPGRVVLTLDVGL